jgi:hypothetical protein
MRASHRGVIGRVDGRTRCPPRGLEDFWASICWDLKAPGRLAGAQIDSHPINWPLPHCGRASGQGAICQGARASTSLIVDIGTGYPHFEPARAQTGVRAQRRRGRTFPAQTASRRFQCAFPGPAQEQLGQLERDGRRAGARAASCAGRPPPESLQICDTVRSVR